jgi:hypothetical protein
MDALPPDTHLAADPLANAARVRHRLARAVAVLPDAALRRPVGRT